MDIFIVLCALLAGLLVGAIGTVWLVAPLVGREEAHRALAWYLARRHIEKIEADALAWMAGVVEAARQARSAEPIISAFGDRAADARARAANGTTPTSGKRS